MQRLSSCRRDAMSCSRVRTALAATILAALPGAALAQFPPPPGTAPVQDRWPEPTKSPQAQAAPAPAARPAPKRAAPPAPAPAAAPAPAPAGEEPLQTPAPAAAKKPPAPAPT